MALDRFGEVYSVPRQLGIKTKDVAARLGDSRDLPDVAQAKTHIAQTGLDHVAKAQADWDQRRKDDTAQLAFEKRRLVDQQRTERQALMAAMEQRQLKEAKARQARFRSGLAGMWDFLRGERARIRQRNEQEAAVCDRRDMTEKDRLIQAQLDQRRDLTHRLRQKRDQHTTAAQDLRQDVQRFKEMRRQADAALHNAAPHHSKRPRRTRGREPEP